MRRLAAERLVLRLGGTGLDLEVELALDVVLVVVDPHRQSPGADDPDHLLAGHVLLHQLDDPLPADGRGTFSTLASLSAARDCWASCTIAASVAVRRISGMSPRM